jgi:hypothetical protein
MGSTGRPRRHVLTTVSVGRSGLIGRRTALVALLSSLLLLGVTGVAQAALPSVTIVAASNVGETTATLNGTVNPEGTDTKYHFDVYDTEPGDQDTCESEMGLFGLEIGTKGEELQRDAGSGKKAVAVSGTVTELDPGATYCYTVVADRDELAREEDGELSVNSLGQYEESEEEEVVESGQIDFTTVGKPPPPPSPPSVTLRGATEVGPTHAVIADNVNPNGAETTYYFEYGKTTQYGSRIPATPEGIGAGTQQIDCWNEISNLEIGTTYHFRIVATNANGTTPGPDQEFTTSGASIVLRGATEVNTTHAVIADNVDPNGYETQYQFEYGRTTQYGSKMPATPEGIGAGTQQIDCWNEIEHLEPGMTYHFRVVATNAIGTTYGPDQEFTTLGATLTLRGATELSTTHAVIGDNVDPSGYETTYQFEYGKTTQYGSKIPVSPEGIGSGTQAIFCWNEIEHLESGTTYHFRIVLNDAGTTAYGPDQEFTLGPVIVLRGATEVNTTHAVIADNVDPSGLETQYQFEYGKTTKYGSKIPATPEGIGAGTQQIDCWNEIEKLEPGTTYHFRIVATNALGTTHGPDQEFTTLSAIITLRGATEVNPTHAVIADNVDPNGYETSYQFEYGKTTKYGSKMPATPEGIGAGTQPIDCWNEIEHLEPDTTYHFRVAATNAYGTTYGADQDFTTPGATITLRGATEVSSTHAVIADNVDPSGYETSYQFEYGKTAGQYTQKIPGTSEGIGAGTLPIDCWNEIEKLEPGTTYHFRVVVTDAGGTTYGPDQEFTTSGSPIYGSSFGSLGSGSGQLHEPRSLALNGKGETVVADEENNRIDVFNEKGEFVKAFGFGVSNGKAELETCTSSCKAGIAGSSTGELKAPKGVAVDSKGDILVADTGNNRIEEFNEKGESPKVFGSSGTGGGQFDEPKGIAIDSHNDVWIADTENFRIQELGEEGKFIKTFGFGVGSEKAGKENEKFEVCTKSCKAGIPGTGVGQFVAPRALAVAPNGSVWVADTWNNRIEEFNEWGQKPRVYGSAGAGNGQFKEPKGIAVDSHNDVWVADSENDRVQELGENGEFVLAFGFGVSNGESKFEDCTSSCKAGIAGSGSGQFKEPWGIQVESHGDVYVSDSENDRVEKFAPNG